MPDDLILAAAAFFAGVLNTVTGGGTVLTFPALAYTGVPIAIANATNAVAVFPGYLGGAVGFWRELAAFDRRRLLRITASTAVGGLIGSLLLLVSSNEAFAAVAPFLLALATLVFALGPRLRAWASKVGGAEGSVGIGLVSIYGGYLNGGLGILLLALFSLWGMRDMNAMNGLKSGLSFILSAISVATFAVAGIVAWPQAVAMMAAATLGGCVGAPVVRALPAAAIRATVIGIGAAMSAAFFVRWLS